MKKIFRSIVSLSLLLAILVIAWPMESHAINTSGVSEITVAATANAASLKTPALVSAVNVNGGVNVKWMKVTGAKGYAIYRKTSGTGWSKIATVTGASTVSYLDKKVSSGTTYTYTVRAYSGSTYSGYNKAGVSVKYLATPKLISAANTAKGVTVSWQKVTGAAKYRLYYSTNGGKSWKKLKDVTGTSCTLTGGTSGKTYTYTVRAMSDSTMSYYNKTGVSTMKLTIPQLIGVSNTANGVTVSWQKVTGATKYRLYYSTNGGKSWKKLKDVTSTSCTLAGGTSGKTYTYTVRAINGSTMSYYDKTGVSTMKLAIPTLVSATNSNNGVTVTWKAVPGATKYRVYYSSNGATWSKTGYKETTNTSYTFTDSTSDSTYTYTVRAVNGSSISYYDKAGISVKYLAAPILSNATITDGTIEVTWKKVAGAKGYVIYRKVNGGSWVRQGASSGTSFIDWDAEQGVNYTYTVRAYNGSIYSSYNKSGVSSIILTTPKLQTAKADLTGITVSWSKVVGASGYRVYRKVSSGSWQLLKNVTATSYVDTDVTSGTTYIYTVRAYSGSVLSEYNQSGVLATFILPSLSQTQLAMVKGEMASLVVQNPVGAVIWASSNPSVAAVENGIVTATDIGTASITATTGGKVLTCTVVVSSNIEISDQEITIVYPDVASLSLKDKLTSSEVTGVFWQTSNASVATVNNGVITPVSIGKAVINADYEGESFSCSVTVTTAATLDMTDIQLEPDETASLTVTGNLGSVIWSSSNPGVAAVADGLVSAVNPGTAIITADVDGKSLTCSVTVEADKTELNALISTASDYCNTQGMEMYYTVSSWAVMKSALSVAQSVSSNLTATVGQVSDAVTELKSALDGLTKLAFEDGELVYYPELSRQVLEEINDYREANGLTRLEWCENYADTCRIQASYNCMAYVLDYKAYEQYLAGNWDPARHMGFEIGAWVGGGGTAETAAKRFVPMWQGSPLHNKALLDTDERLCFGGIAICSYTINGRSSGYVCIFTNGNIDVADYDYGMVCSVPITDFCTIDQVLNCVEK